jgi:general stress protein 26
MTENNKMCVKTANRASKQRNVRQNNETKQRNNETWVKTTQRASKQRNVRKNNEICVNYEFPPFFISPFFLFLWENARTLAQKKTKQ